MPDYLKPTKKNVNPSLVAELQKQANSGSALSHDDLMTLLPLVFRPATIGAGLYRSGEALGNISDQAAQNKIAPLQDWGQLFGSLASIQNPLAAGESSLALRLARLYNSLRGN